MFHCWLVKLYEYNNDTSQTFSLLALFSSLADYTLVYNIFMFILPFLKIIFNLATTEELMVNCAHTLIYTYIWFYKCKNIEDTTNRIIVQVTGLEPFSIFTRKSSITWHHQRWQSNVWFICVGVRALNHHWGFFQPQPYQDFDRSRTID